MFDVIVVGGRCGGSSLGSSLGLLLGRLGYRVLVVDRGVFPSDALSTHLVHPPGVGALRRWGLLGEVVGSGCPGIVRYSFDFGG